jgi:transcriptional regulator with PAS, ATPase and Fis domain
MVNVLERVLNALDGDLIEVAHLPFVTSGRGDARHRQPDPGRLRRLVKDSEQQALQQALEMTQGNKARAARLLGIHRASLYRKLGRKP